MDTTAPIKNGASTRVVVLLTIAAFVLGVLLTAGVAAVHRFITDDSRPNLTIADVYDDDLRSLVNGAAPSKAACGTRSGCVEGIEGDRVSVYQFESLNLAREAIMFGNADFYRADRLVFEFGDGLTEKERLGILHGVEGFMTPTSD